MQFLIYGAMALAAVLVYKLVSDKAVVPGAASASDVASSANKAAQRGWYIAEGLGLMATGKSLGIDLDAYLKAPRMASPTFGLINNGDGASSDSKTLMLARGVVEGFMMDKPGGTRFWVVSYTAPMSAQTVGNTLVPRVPPIAEPVSTTTKSVGALFLLKDTDFTV